MLDLARFFLVPDDPLATAAKIKEYLTVNFFYTLEPSRKKQWDDPAWEFLLTAGEGFCVHFATSFALLARMNDIRSRYVTGFLVNIPRDSTTAKVTGYSAHAWVEIWVPGTGWVVREATPPMLPEFMDDPFYFEMYNPFQSRYTGRQLELIMGDRVSRAYESKEARTGVKLNPAPGIFIFLSAVLAAGILYILTRSIYAIGTPLRKVRLISRHLVRRGEVMGVQKPETTGWIGWADGFTEHRKKTGRALRRTSAILNSIFFGGRPAISRDVKFLRRVYRLLSKTQKKETISGKS